MRLVGFYNNGNTCYINSVLQCFINDVLFRNSIFKRFLADKENIPENSEFGIIKEIIQTVNLLQQEQENTFVKFNLNKFNEILFKNSYFNRFEQHDAHEFLLKVLDMFEKDIKDVYYGQAKLKIKCMKCNNIKEVIEDFSTINLTVNSTETLHLYDLFNNYLKKELHDDSDNLYYCENCKCNTITEKQINLWKLPKRLIVVLKRYNQNGNKLNTKIKYPIDFMLIKETSSQKIRSFSLKNIIYHIGHQNHGHYINSSRINNKWYLIDDDSISINSKDIIENNNAYILIYSVN
jgi:ubiquitin C-terminal hydrolase